MVEECRVWRELVDTSWGRAPVKLGSAFGRDSLTCERLFDVLIRARATDARFWFNVETQPGQYNRQHNAPTPEEALPRDGDRTFERYGARVGKTFGGRFCLRLPRAEQHDRAFAQLATTLFADLEHVLGRTPRTESVIFVGDYDFTPVGVHTDPVPIIQAVVSGRKRAHFWSPETWNRRPRETNSPRESLSDATTVELATGDMVYWPEGHYHVFESEQLSVGVSFGFPDEIG